MCTPIAKWEQQGVFHTPGSEGAGPAYSQNGDNPSISESVTLPDQGDQRNKGTSGGADPSPASPGDK